MEENSIRENEEENVFDSEQIEKALQHWEAVRRKIMIGGQISVLPLAAAAALAVIFFIIGKGALVKSAITVLCDLPMWVPVLVAAAESVWVLCMRKNIRDLSELEMALLDTSRPYKERDYSRKSKTGINVLPYKKVLSELVSLFCGWIYAACFFWFIGSYN